MPAHKIPTNILKLRGADKNHPGRLRVREHEPKPVKGKAIAPRWLDVQGQKLFRHLVKITSEMNVLSVSDHFSLAMVCDAYADYLVANEAVQAHGATYKVTNRDGMELIKANPAVAMKADAWRRVVTGLGKFGMTPSERAGVTVIPEKTRNRFDDD